MSMLNTLEDIIQILRRTIMALELYGLGTGTEACSWLKQRSKEACESAFGLTNINKNGINLSLTTFRVCLINSPTYAFDLSPRDISTQEFDTLEGVNQSNSFQIPLVFFRDVFINPCPMS